MIKVFTFDGDGCLFDTREHVIRITHKAAESLGSLTTPQLISDAFSAGLPLPEVFRRAAPNIKDPHKMVERFYDFDRSEGYESIRAFSGSHVALKLLGELKIPRVLVTNRDESTYAILEHTKLIELVDDVITTDDVPAHLHKPDPYGLLMGIQRAGGIPEESAFMGDTAGDIETGIRAGVAAKIGFTEGFSTKQQLLDAGATDILSGWECVPAFIATHETR